jgi:hypothetical protein
MNWYYHHAERQIGPVPEAELVELRRSGVVTADTLVWREGMANWMRFHEAGLAVNLAAAPAGVPPVMPLGALLSSLPQATKRIACPRCAAALPAESLNPPTLQPCPVCQTAIQVEVFPAMFRRIGAGQLSQGVLEEAEAACFFHEQKRAVVPCDVCGRFLCALCDCEFNGQHYCPGCLETGRDKVTIKVLATKRVRYDKLTFAVAVLPLILLPVTIVTAPIAAMLFFWHRKSARGITQTSQGWMIAGGVIAFLEIAGWILFFIS